MKELYKESLKNNSFIHLKNILKELKSHKNTPLYKIEAIQELINTR